MSDDTLFGYERQWNTPEMEYTCDGCGTQNQPIYIVGRKDLCYHCLNNKFQEANVKKALRSAVLAIYFADSADYKSALWQVVEALDPKIAELLENSEQEAYKAVE